jgi:hypothetical protein
LSNAFNLGEGKVEREEEMIQRERRRKRKRGNERGNEREGEE